MKIKKIPLFLKTNWRWILLLGWIIWITAVTLDVQDMAQRANKEYKSKSKSALEQYYSDRASNGGTWEFKDWTKD